MESCVMNHSERQMHKRPRSPPPPSRRSRSRSRSRSRWEEFIQFDFLYLIWFAFYLLITVNPSIWNVWNLLHFLIILFDYFFSSIFHFRKKNTHTIRLKQITKTTTSITVNGSLSWLSFIRSSTYRSICWPTSYISFTCKPIKIHPNQYSIFTLPKKERKKWWRQRKTHTQTHQTMQFLNDNQRKNAKEKSISIKYTLNRNINVLKYIHLNGKVIGDGQLLNVYA